MTEHVVFYVSSTGEKVVEHVAYSYAEAVAWAGECQSATDVELRIEEREMDEDDVPTEEDVVHVLLIPEEPA